MMITNFIREANTEHEIYFMLTAFIEAMRFSDKLNLLSEHLTSLPVTGMDDVRGRSAKLIAELDGASQRLDDRACMVVKQALVVFGTALTRLELFQRMAQPQRSAPQTTAWPDIVAGDTEASSFESLNGDGMMVELRL
jgi:hypothetical protein